MKHLFLASTILLGLSSPLFAQSTAEKTGINSALGVAPKTEDFVKQVSISDMFEIEAGKIAQTKANGPSQTFAGQMIADHTKTSTELKGLLTEGKVKAVAPGALDDAHQKKLDKLKELDGAAFNKQYNSDQVSAHKDAVDLFERYAKGGDNAALKDWAGKTLPALKHHLQMAQELK